MIIEIFSFGDIKLFYRCSACGGLVQYYGPTHNCTVFVKEHYYNHTHIMVTVPTTAYNVDVILQHD